MIARLVLVAWATTAAGFDARQRRLPNWLTLGGLMGGGIYALATGSSLLGGNPANALLAAAIAFLVLLPAHLAGWMGAGDVKLFAAMGMLGGGQILLPTLIVASIIAGIGALVLIVSNRTRRGTIAQEQRPLPFGVGLAAGFALAVLDVLPELAWHG